jgi:hypothetical protein
LCQDNFLLGDCYTPARDSTSAGRAKVIEPLSMGTSRNFPDLPVICIFNRRVTSKIDMPQTLARLHATELLITHAKFNLNLRK